MATTIKYPLTFSVFQNVGAGQPAPVRKKTEADTQSFVYGAPLVFDLSEEDVKLATDTTVEGIGIAMSYATGTGGSDIYVMEFGPHILFRAPILNAGAAAAADAAYVGRAFSWIARTDGYGYGIDVNDESSNDWFVVRALDPNTPDGTSAGFAIVSVLPAVYDQYSVA